MVIDNQKKEIPCGWLPQGSFFATGEVASGWCHNGGRFYRPQPLQNQRPENTPEYAGQQGKHNISDGHRDNLPSLPDWLG